LRKIACALLVFLGLPCQAVAGGEDPHYSEAGFFDIHVCNWPDKPPFIMALLSTQQYDSLERVFVYTPLGDLLGELNLARYRSFKTKEGKDKRAFITHFGLPDKAADGWYRAVISMKDGRRIEAMDYVVHAVMPLPAGMLPAADAVDVALPGELRWNPVPGASFYQVFVYDKWNDELVYKTPVITDTVVKLPPGVLQPGGRYGWRVNARDVNEHVLLGDFNHGTTGPEFLFTTR
jgi:hypothetical protein